jgi:hypothetical protein
MGWFPPTGNARGCILQNSYDKLSIVLEAGLPDKTRLT